MTKKKGSDDKPLAAPLAAAEEAVAPDSDVSIPQEPAPPEITAKAERGEEVLDWQKPDYSGPLSIEQAMWRNERMGRK